MNKNKMNKIYFVHLNKQKYHPRYLVPAVLALRFSWSLRPAQFGVINVFQQRFNLVIYPN